MEPPGVTRPLLLLLPVWPTLACKGDSTPGAMVETVLLIDIAMALLALLGLVRFLGLVAGAIVSV